MKTRKSLSLREIADTTKHVSAPPARDALAGDPSPTDEVAKQGAEAASTAAAAKALQIEIERGLVSPMHSSTYRLWSGAAEALGDISEIIPIAFGAYEFGKAGLAVAKARLSGGCTPGF